MHFTNQHTMALACAAMAFDGLNCQQHGNTASQLAACIGEVLEHFPTAQLSQDGKEFYLQCANDFTLGNEASAAQTWFSAHAAWTPCATLC